MSGVSRAQRLARRRERQEQHIEQLQMQQIEQYSNQIANQTATGEQPEAIPETTSSTPTPIEDQPQSTSTEPGQTPVYSSPDGVGPNPQDAHLSTASHPPIIEDTPEFAAFLHSVTNDVYPPQPMSHGSSGTMQGLESAEIRNEEVSPANTTMCILGVYLSFQLIAAAEPCA